MALFNFARWGKRGDGADFVPGQRPPRSSDSVERMRVRARQRLIGAAVLVVLGVVGFGLLFEGEPRPAPELAAMPQPGDAPALVLDLGTPAVAEKPAHAADDKAQPQASPAAPASVAQAAPEEKPSKPNEKIAEKSAAKSSDKAADKSTNKPTDKTVAEKEKTKAAEKPKSNEKPAEKPSDKAKPDQNAFEKIVQQASTTAQPKPANAEAERARALLEGRSPAPAAAPAPSQRFIVQVGAFADSTKVDEVRTKLRGQGIATFTQTVQTRDGARIRVRVGPFNTRAEAEAAAARVSGAGFGASVMPQ